MASVLNSASCAHLTPWSRIAHLVKKLATFCGTRSFVNHTHKDRVLIFIVGDKSIQSTPYPSVSLRFVVIFFSQLYSHLLNVPFLQGLPMKIYYAFFFSSRMTFAPLILSSLTLLGYKLMDDGEKK
jgi:hypothetical protein